MKLGENLFKYDKRITEPIYNNKSSRGLRLSLQKSGFKMLQYMLNLKAPWLPQPSSEGIWTAPSQL